MEASNELVRIFSNIEDPRKDINLRHNLIDIIVIGIVSVICGADTWEHMTLFARSKEQFLMRFLELPNGIPSKDTIRRTFCLIDSEQFEHSFIEWVNSISDRVSGQVISFDGKTIRGAKSHGKKSPIHMVSAWASETNMVLGQVKTSEKSNEITAIPELIDLLDITGDVITIDAIGTQKEIAKKIIENEADYILAAKNNQPQLMENIKDEFRFSKNSKTIKNEDIGHGRIETRQCSVVTDFEFLTKEDGWENIKSIIRIESTREFKNSNKETEVATRYYISSLQQTPEYFQAAIRSHWGIENKLHWTLDVAFSEDASRKRKGNAAQNYSVLLKMALNLIKNEKSKKLSVKSKRLQAAWDNDYLLKILNVKV